MKRFLNTPLFMLMLAGLISCEDKDLAMPDMDYDVERQDNLPIQLITTIENPVIQGDEPATRTVTNAKTEFSFGDPENLIPGDIIHVQSTFSCMDETKGEYTESRYVALQYTENGTWLPMGNASFAWNNDAVSAKFKAYYVHGSTGALTDNVGEGQSTTTRTLFTDIVDGEDPLMAVTDDIKYGHTVELKFRHMLTHLTLIELDAGIDDFLIMSVEWDAARDKNQHPFNNAFEISLGKDDQNEPKIEITYLNVPSELKESDYATLIKAPTNLVRDRVTRKESSQVGFFLQPGCMYNAFDIYYSNGDRYLSYVNSNPNSKEVLDMNNRYTFNVKKSAGVSISTPPEEKWDESDDFTVVVDAEGFLKAVATNGIYTQTDEKTGEEIVILEPTVNPAGTLLKKNIKFKDPYYHIFPHPETSTDENGNTIEPYDFVPSVGADNVFDGGYHYIKDIECTLFFENHGTIKNVGLVDVNIGNGDYGPWESSQNFWKDLSEDQIYSKAYEYQRSGAITTNNNGFIQNVRIKNLNLNVGIHITENDQEAHSVGGLFGVNNTGGYVEKVYLSGDININVSNYTGFENVPEVNIGGLAGQNIGTIIEVEQLVDNRESLTEGHKPQPVKITINNTLAGKSGAYYIGGLTGTNTGKLSEVTIPTPEDAIKVVSTLSSGVISNIGGISGRAESSQGNEISSCLIASGEVIAGKTIKSSQVDAFSYTGGLVGVVSERTLVNNVTSFCSVTGYTEPDTSVSKATGGAFGNIMEYQGDYKGTFSAVASFPETLSGTSAGCFVGEAPFGRTWSDYEDSADVKKFDTIDYIGKNSAKLNQ